MNEKIITPIIIGILTISGSFVIAIFTPGSFLLYPVFEIETDKFQPSENLIDGLDVISIKNTGWIQAKNVEIYIQAFASDSKIVKSICPEGNIVPSKEWKRDHEIKIERLSVNLVCSIGLIQNSNNTIYDVIITAENAPAYTWIGKTERTQSLSNPAELTVFVILLTGTITSVITVIVQWNHKKRIEEEKKRRLASPLAIENCPECGSNKLSKSTSYDSKRDDMYYDIVCGKCGWIDGGEL